MWMERRPTYTLVFYADLDMNFFHMNFITLLPKSNSIFYQQIPNRKIYILISKKITADLIDAKGITLYAYSLYNLLVVMLDLLPSRS